MSLLALDKTFAGRRVPPWLRHFESEPKEALRDLLLGGADLGHLNPADPERVLLDWIESLGARSGLIAEVDRALAGWIENSWGDPDPKGLGAAVAAVSWCRAADLISGCPGEEGLSDAAKALRERFLEEPSFLRSISEGRARDPEARAWLALAEHQSDRSLLSRWWSLCSLPPDVPWYHGDLGIFGLRRLPPEIPGHTGSFPKEVPEGLARLADALARRVEDGWLAKEAAQEELTATVRLTMAAYRFPQDKWIPYWRHALQERRIREPLAESWIRSLSPKLVQVSEKRPTTRARWIQPDPGWKRRIPAIEASLEREELGATEKAQRLLDEQRFYAQATGDSHFVVRSACNFAGKLREADSRKALEWVRLALDFDPWDEFAWTTMVAVNLTMGRLPEAARAAQEAARRFPNDPVVHNGLAEVFRAQGRFDDAERAYRLATTKFPDDPVSHNGLAEVLRTQGRLDDAERAYRLATRKFPKDPFAHTGLAEVLRAKGRFDDAADLVVEALKHEPDNEVTRNNLENLRAQRTKTLKVPSTSRRGRISRSVQGVTQTPTTEAARLQVDDLNTLLSDTLLLRRWSRHLAQGPGGQPGDFRQRAHAALEKLLLLESRSSLAASEAGLLTIKEGDLEQGLQLLRTASQRFPGSARVRYALARAERLAVSACTLDLLDPERPVRSWRRLNRIEAQLGPVALLGEARTWLEQADGAAREAGARRSLGQLAHWIDEQLSRGSEPRKGAAEINAWWAREAWRLAFGDRIDRKEEDLTHLPYYLERVRAYAAELDLHEEDMVYRVAAA